VADDRSSHGIFRFKISPEFSLECIFPENSPVCCLSGCGCPACGTADSGQSRLLWRSCSCLKTIFPPSFPL
jgi:hypothetical protein